MDSRGRCGYFCYFLLTEMWELWIFCEVVVAQKKGKPTMTTIATRRSVLKIAAGAAAGSLAMREGADAFGAGEARVRSAVPIARVIYLEPDLYSAAEAGAPDGTEGSGH